MSTNLPANIQSMATGLAASVRTVGASSDVYFMKMVEGEFLYGKEETLVEEGSLWAVNPASFEHGWVAWGDEEHGTKGKNLGEKMGPAAQPLFPEEDLPKVDGSWSKAIAFSLSCINGEDEGTLCLYKANSLGGRRAYGDLLEGIVERITKGDAEIVPIVMLRADSYRHSSYGKTWFPIFEVVEWRTLYDTSPVEDSEDDDLEQEPAEKPTRRRSRAAKPPVEEEEAQGNDEGEEPPAPARRRRRRSS